MTRTKESTPTSVGDGLGQAADQSRSRSRLSTALWPAGVVAVFLAIWEALSRTGTVNAIILPPPSEILLAGWTVIQRPIFWEGVWVTFQETIFGFLLGASVAWVTGTLITFFKPVRLAIYPLVIAFQNTPRVALAPLVIIWFGFGLFAKVMMAAIICFFPVLLAVVTAQTTVESDARLIMRSLGASKFLTWRRLELPHSLPILFSALKLSMTFALIGAIVAEFVSGDEGLGVLIKTFNFQLNVDRGFFVIVFLALLGLLLYGLIALVEKRVVFWRDAA